MTDTTLIQRWEQLCQGIAKTPLVFIDEYNGVKVYVKKDFEGHPTIVGNKWRKLKYNLKYFCESPQLQEIVSFGGAHSNHILSLGAACHVLGINCTLLIRGEELTNDDNEILRKISGWGTHLIMVNRTDYRLKEHGLAYTNYVKDRSNIYSIPEGGTNQLALSGVGEVAVEIMQQLPNVTHIITSAGTGGTAAGLHLHLNSSIKLCVYPALKGNWMKEEILKWSTDSSLEGRLIIRSDYHFGGYAKGRNEMQQYSNEMMTKYDFPLDAIYTSKAWFGMMKDIKDGFYPAGSKLVFYHSGGVY